MEKRILIADGDAAALQSASRSLRSQGWRVQTATSGLQALAALSREAFDCVAVSLCLPAVNGYELLRYARERIPSASRLALVRSSSTRLAEADASLVHAYIAAPGIGAFSLRPPHAA